MAQRIDAIMFDMGGVLRRSTQKKDEKHRIQGAAQILELLGSKQPAAEFASLLYTRARAYKEWAEQTLVELSEVDIWTRWMLPDWPVETIAPLGPQLNQIWHKVQGTRFVLPETAPVILELFRRGYRLGLVSNTISYNEVPDLLKKIGVFDCFETIMLSTRFGWRKPHPSIFLAAAEAMQVPPERCAYVGDQPNRDVAGSRKAGFGQSIIVQSPLRPLPPVGDPLLTPDHLIDSLIELFEIFPPRYRSERRTYNGETPTKAGASWNASLSSMWAIGRFSHFPDFYAQAEQLGFTHIELNHQVDSAMLEGPESGRYQFSSVHEPCPADVSVPALKEHNWLISATDEENRQQGVRMVKRSINLASDLGARVVIVHAGEVDGDPGLEIQLRRLFDVGKVETPEYLDVKDKLVKARALQSPPHLEAVQKSLRELVEYASRYRIRLGIENRYHYLHIPSLDEMQVLLALANNEQLGFWYDVGHAHAMDKLGFFPHEQWLKHFASRMIGVHLHDARGIKDHYAPGLGEVDFSMVARYLPVNAIRTLELHPSNTPEQITAGLEYLQEKRCVNNIILT